MHSFLPYLRTTALCCIPGSNSEHTSSCLHQGSMKAYSANFFKVAQAVIPERPVDPETRKLSLLNVGHRFHSSVWHLPEFFCLTNEAIRFIFSLWKQRYLPCSWIFTDSDITHQVFSHNLWQHQQLLQLLPWPLYLQKKTVAGLLKAQIDKEMHKYNKSKHEVNDFGDTALKLI